LQGVLFSNPNNRSKNFQLLALRAVCCFAMQSSHLSGSSHLPKSHFHKSLLATPGYHTCTVTLSDETWFSLDLYIIPKSSSWLPAICLPGNDKEINVRLKNPTITLSRPLLALRTLPFGPASLEPLFEKISIMAPTYTLHSTKENKNTYKSLIAAKYAGASIDLASNFEFGKTNKTPEYLKMNPNGKVTSGLLHQLQATPQVFQICAPAWGAFSFE